MSYNKQVWLWSNSDLICVFIKLFIVSMKVFRIIRFTLGHVDVNGHFCRKIASFVFLLFMSPVNVLNILNISASMNCIYLIIFFVNLRFCSSIWNEFELFCNHSKYCSKLYYGQYCLMCIGPSHKLHFSIELHYLNLYLLSFWLLFLAVIQQCNLKLSHALNSHRDHKI